jgi:hypothetical protein
MQRFLPRQLLAVRIINALNFKVYRLKYSRNALHINVLPFAPYFRQRFAPSFRHRRRSQGYTGAFS